MDGATAVPLASFFVLDLVKFFGRSFSTEYDVEISQLYKYDVKLNLLFGRFTSKWFPLKLLSFIASGPNGKLALNDANF